MPLSRPEKFLCCFVAVLVVLAVALPGVPQDPAYHRFADTRTLMRVPHAMDALSNIFFLALGGIALVAGVSCLPKHGKGPNWAALIAAYALAKVLEMGDLQVFQITQGVVSGHTLKHFFAALAALAVLLPLARGPLPVAGAGQAT